jgi:hypothetical protein
MDFLPRFSAGDVAYKFQSAEEFAARHEAATRAEFELEVAEINSHNALKLVFNAWVIKQIGLLSFVMRADLRKMGNFKPQPSQGFSLAFVDYQNGGDESDEDDSAESVNNRVKQKESGRLVTFPCRGSTDYIELNDEWKNTTEFTLTVKQKALHRIRRFLRPLQEGTGSPVNARRRDSEAVRVRLVVCASDLTMTTQLGALQSIMDGTASATGREAFNYLLKFENPKRLVNMFEEFPQMRNLGLIKSHTVREGLGNIFDSLDNDQLKAFLGLESLPAGICFVPGGEFPFNAKLLFFALSCSNPD